MKVDAFTLKRHVATGALALSLLGGSAVGVAAQGNGNQTGGAAGLVAAVVQIAADDVVDVRVVDSLNNLRALNNILNNSPILSQNDIDVTVGDVSILNDVQVGLLNDFLNANDIDIDDVVAIGLLSTGDIIVFV